MLTQEPLASISAIIITRNYGCFIEDAISSVINQKLQPNELIIVDDGSTDDTKIIVGNFTQHFEWIKYYSIFPSGIAIARNTGISKSIGEWIAFLDADDIWTEDKLSVQIRYMLQNPYCVSTTHQSFKFEDNFKIPPQLAKGDLSKSLPSYGTNSLMFSREIYEKVGPFDSALILHSDSDWLIRAKKLGVPHHIIQNSLLIRRIHDKNATSVSEEERQKHKKILEQRHSQI